MRKLVVLCLAIVLIFMLGGCAQVFISDEFKRIMEQRPASMQEIWEIEDEYAFVSELSMYIAEKCEYGSNLDVLSEEEKVFYITQTLEMEVNNGGFWQFFFNAPQDVFCETAAALEAIGAEKTAALYREAVTVFGEELPDSRAARVKILGKSGMEEGYALLSPYDDAFYAYEEDLNALNYAYIQSNRNAFS